MRLKDKVAVVVGGGQTMGETIGNGRATAICFAREGATVLVVDRDLGSAEETVNTINAEGGSAAALVADVTREPDCAAIAKESLSRYGRIDVLHNNVGRSEGDAATTELKEEAWLALMDINLKSVFLTCKHVLTVMRTQKAGVITNISSSSSV